MCKIQTRDLYVSENSNYRPSTVEREPSNSNDIAKKRNVCVTLQTKLSHAGGEIGEPNSEHGGVRAGSGGSREIDHMQGRKSERDGTVRGEILENRRRL